MPKSVCLLVQRTEAVREPVELLFVSPASISTLRELAPDSSRSKSFEEVKKFIDLLPHLLNEAKQGKYSPEKLRNMILRNLTGDTLQLL